ncbi:hypothetical protein [Neisseria flavescens]|nr:hypothetical protein [Neisseria flavescens]
MANEKIEVGYRHIGTFAVLPITLSLIFYQPAKQAIMKNTLKFNNQP